MVQGGDGWWTVGTGGTLINLVTDFDATEAGFAVTRWSPDAEFLIDDTGLFWWDPDETNVRINPGGVRYPPGTGGFGSGDLQCAGDQCTGGITVTKRVDGPDINPDFDYTGAVTGTIRPGEFLYEELPAGMYTITEAPDEVALVGIECDQPGAVVDLNAGSVTLTIEERQNVLCTFISEVPDADDDGIPDDRDPCPNDDQNLCLFPSPGSGGGGGGGGGRPGEEQPEELSDCRELGSGLDSCQMRAGDVITYRSTGVFATVESFFARTWFTHSAIVLCTPRLTAEDPVTQWTCNDDFDFDGVPEVLFADAVPDDNNVCGTVIPDSGKQELGIRTLVNSAWDIPQSCLGGVESFGHARPIEELGPGRIAATWARNKIETEGPVLDYPDFRVKTGNAPLFNCCDEPDGRDFYCSSFVAAAYKYAGRDIEWIPGDWISPDDVFYSGRVKQMLAASGVVSVSGPAHLTVTDQLGRTSGYAASGEEVLQIPSSSINQNGPDTFWPTVERTETVSAGGLASDWTVRLEAIGAGGDFEVGARYVYPGSAPDSVGGVIGEGETLEFSMGELAHAPPEVDLRADATSLPWTVAFDASASHAREGDLVSYKWDFDGDGTADATTDTPTVLYPYPSTTSAAEASVQVVDSSGASAEAFAYLTFNEVGELQPRPTLSATPRTGLPPLNAHFSIAGVGANAVEAWIWDFGDGTRAFTTGPAIDYDYDVPGTYDALVFSAEDSSIQARTSVRILEQGPPTAVDDFVEVDEDEATPIGVRGNDTDPDLNLDPDVFRVLSGPENGQVRVRLGGAVVFVPDSNYAGPDSFVYEIADLDGNTSAATVTIEVRSLNDAPTARVRARITSGILLPSM